MSHVYSSLAENDIMSTVLVYYSLLQQLTKCCSNENIGGKCS